MLISWTIDKFIQHKCQRGINSIAYHLFSNDVLHNFMDGIIILLSYGISPLSGISSTLAVLLHEIPHELCEWGIMLKANFSYRKVVLLNLIAAMVAIAGMGAAYLFFQLFQTWTPYFVATITGNFIFIANAKLLPLALRSTMPIVTFRNLLVFFSGFLLIGCSNFIHPHLH
ncbi:MAG: ZIP family metal transporter [Bacteroidia bacterium]|nr:ZIP family metal transporter [Bacteroidia bacterium]